MKKITGLFIVILITTFSGFSQQTNITKLNIELLNPRPKGYENSDCSYSKRKGELPIFLTDFMGNAVVKVNGKIEALKLSKTGGDKSGKLIYTYSNDNFVAILKTGSDFRSGVMTLKNGQSITQTNIIGHCSTDGGD